MSYEKRRHFRIKYPIPERPKFEVSGHTLVVVDLSESGIKIIGNPNFRPKIRQTITGRLIFADQSTELLEGTVVRLVGDFIMLGLKKHISIDRLRVEADRLITRYGNVEQAKAHE